ncbi:MAG: hypothetical protein GF418_00260 [Chitinivibrionales bacterium]|nr:hypothetical protein [Chitinivibrionales bacterium]MBD3394032.1 hypothetical protein [Chitinivibrionales bacterium]
MRRKLFAKTAPAAALAAVAAGMLVCSPNVPEKVDEGLITIGLSLSRPGVREADFTGTPLDVIIVLSDTVHFDDIDWHVGKGIYLRPARQESDSFVTSIYWSKNGIPATVDSATGYPYDSIYVSVDAVPSNKVRVNVRNRAPSVEYVNVEDTTYYVGENIYNDNVIVHEVDTALEVYIEIDAIDLDSDPLATTWRAAVDTTALKAYVGSEVKRVYQTPFTNFRDTIMVDVIDGNGGAVNLKLVLVRISGISPVVFDSVRVGATTFAVDGASVNYETVTIDSLPIVVYTLAQQPVLLWSASNGTVDSTGPFEAMYACTLDSRLDTLQTDTTEVLDSIHIDMTNASLDTSRLSIVVVKKPANNRPVIDSMTVDSVKYDSLARARGGALITLTAYGRDPDAQALSYAWQTKVTDRLQAQSGNEAQYKCLTDPYEDTIIVTVSDPLDFSARDTILLSVNLPPVIDSIRINDSLLVSPAATIAVDATRNDTVTVVTFARDPEEQGVSVSWAASYIPNKLSTVNDSTVRYFTIDDTYRDTLTAVVRDAEGFTAGQTIYLDIANSRPSIDSVLTPGDTLRFVSPSWSLDATVLEQITMTLFARDVDDNLRGRAWALSEGALGALAEIDPPLHTQAQYTAIDSLYTDTIIISVDDTKDAVARRRIVVNVNNRPPAIDTVKVGSFGYFVRTLNEVTHTTTAPDTLMLTGVAEDPDGDTPAYTWQIGTVVSSGASYEYEGLDQAYSDTLILRVHDAKLTADSVSLILKFTK